MSQQVIVNRKIKFQGDGDQEPNVEGNWNPKKITARWDMTELVLDATNKYTLEVDTDSTIAVGAGGALFTTAATDTRVAMMGAGGIFWYPAKNPVVEFRFQIDVITTVGIYAGFSDAGGEGTAKLPHSISGSTQTATASDSAGFLFDTNQTLKYFNIVSSLASGATKAFTQLASTRVPVAATNLTLRVSIDTAGNARYYWNGIQVGSKLLAVTTTTPLIPVFGIKNNTATAHIATLRYIRAWCDP